MRDLAGTITPKASRGPGGRKYISEKGKFCIQSLFPLSFLSAALPRRTLSQPSHLREPHAKAVCLSKKMEGDATGEKQFEKYILQQFSWDALPPEVKKQMGNTKDTWTHHVCRYSIRHQLRWKTNLVKQFILDEKQYYLEVLRFSRTQYMVRSIHFILLEHVWNDFLLRPRKVGNAFQFSTLLRL